MGRPPSALTPDTAALMSSSALGLVSCASITTPEPVPGIGGSLPVIKPCNRPAANGISCKAAAIWDCSTCSDLQHDALNLHHQSHGRGSHAQSQEITVRNVFLLIEVSNDGTQGLSILCVCQSVCPSLRVMSLQLKGLGAHWPHPGFVLWMLQAGELICCRMLLSTHSLG